jgi:hypothetical protein
LKRKRFVLVDESTDSIDSLVRILRLSGYIRLTGAAAAALSDHDVPTEYWRQPSAEQRARELLNGITLLTQCLALEGTTGQQRRQWKRQITAAQRGLEALYARGLDRDLLSRR